jgi:hypothetical protein
MNADKFSVFNRRLSAFIGGQVILGVFQHSAKCACGANGSRIQQDRRGQTIVFRRLSFSGKMTLVSIL